MFFEVQYTAFPGITAELCINKTYVIDITEPGNDTTTSIQPLADAPSTAASLVPRDHAERSRDKRLRDAGFTVIRISPRQLVQHPERFISEVTATISARQNAVRAQRSRR